MESRNERIKKIFPGILDISDELYPVYWPTDDYGYSSLDNTALFGRGMECFSFSTARLCYIAVFRKLFLTVFLIHVRDGLVDIDLSDIMDMEADTYENMIFLDRLEGEPALTDILIRKVFDAYGYHHETASYGIYDLTDGLYDTAADEDEIIRRLEDNCSLIMQENDCMHMESTNLFYQLCMAEWCGQDDIKIWRFSNARLSGILDRDYDLTDGSERIIRDSISRLDYLLFPDDISSGLRAYHEETGDYEFCAVESAYIASSDWHGNSEYWCRLDSAFLNFGALLTIPYIDALMDDVDLRG